MTTLSLSQRAARPTTIDRMLSAAADALNDYVGARQRRRLASVERVAYRHAAVDGQRDRVGAVARQMLPR